MAIGADPITAAVITVAGRQGKSLRGFIVRKEAKAHGTGRDVEGPVQAGDKVVIVEDVVTTGGSSLAAIEKLQAAGLQVQGVMAIVDRLEGGAAAFAQRGYSAADAADHSRFRHRPARGRKRWTGTASHSGSTGVKLRSRSQSPFSSAHPPYPLSP